jgi:hypothetical protein
MTSADIKLCEPKPTRATSHPIPPFRDLISQGKGSSPRVQHTLGTSTLIWVRHWTKYVQLPTSLPCHSNIIAGILSAASVLKDTSPSVFCKYIFFPIPVLYVQIHNKTLRNWDFYGANISGKRGIAEGWSGVGWEGVVRPPRAAMWIF